MSRTWMVGSGVALARRPDLWRTALRVARAHAPARWWERAPFLPVPDRAWMRFRYQTAFASPDGRPTPAEFIDYLEWAKSWRYL